VTGEKFLKLIEKPLPWPSFCVKMECLSRLRVT